MSDDKPVCVLQYSCYIDGIPQVSVTAEGHTHKAAADKAREKLDELVEVLES